MLTVRAPAKVNLLLAVGSRRGDGLHELVSVMQAISLYDEIDIAPGDGFTCVVSPEGAAPKDGTNLAVRAAEAFARLRFEPGQGVSLVLRKSVPTGGGLGGGSADAAAVLIGLNEATGGTQSRKALERLGGSLGSDVPFCVRGGTAVVTGTGDQLTALPVAATLWWVIGIPAMRCSTAEVYARFDALGLGGPLDLRGDPHDLADALARGDTDRIAGLARNDLEAAALDLYPELEPGRLAMQDVGARAVLLAGSGSSWLGLCFDEASAAAAAVGARASGVFERVEVASAISHGPVVL